MQRSLLCPLGLATRISDLAYLAVEDLHLILAVLTALTAFPGVTGQSLVVFLIDASTARNGLETVTPRVIRGLPAIVHTEVYPYPAAQPFAA